MVQSSDQLSSRSIFPREVFSWLVKVSCEEIGLREERERERKEREREREEEKECDVGWMNDDPTNDDDHIDD